MPQHDVRLPHVHLDPAHRLPVPKRLPKPEHAAQPLPGLQNIAVAEMRKQNIGWNRTISHSQILEKFRSFSQALFSNELPVQMGQEFAPEAQRILAQRFSVG